MSGQPLQNPMDADKFRREYLTQLGLRAELDDLNLQANKVYKRTGQKQELQDYRTASEKLRDREGVKQMVRGKLQTITTPAIASEIIEDVDEGDMIFIAQNIDNMIPALKKMYAVGLTTADQFLGFYQRYIRKYMATGGVELGLQQSTGDQILLSLQTIMNQAVDIRQIEAIRDQINSLSATSRLRSERTFRQLDTLEQYLDIVRTNVSDIIREQGRYEPETIAEIQQLLNNMSQNLPTKLQVKTILTRIEVLDRAGDKAGIREKIGELVEIMSQDGSFDLQFRQLKDILERIDATVAIKRTVYRDLDDIERMSLNQIKVYIGDLNERLGFSAFAGVFGDIAREILKRSKPELLELLRRVDDELRTALTLRGDRTPRGGAEEAGGGGEGRGIRGRGHCGQNPCICEMKGTGLVRAYTPKPNDVEGGVKATPKYSQFGRYLIHKNKLNDDIISVRRPSGTFVGDFPSQRVSKNLGKVFRSIIGGGNPMFEDLNSLNEEEKTYLHKIAKSAQIQDRLNIPAPKKDEDEKDIHRFELLKGQIMSGNDNRELIKEFKLLILKLSKRGLIPKGQVKELLVELATMGY